MVRENFKISQEVLKFPYNGNFEKNYNEMFSEKFCYCTIKVREKIIKKNKMDCILSRIEYYYC